MNKKILFLLFIIVSMLSISAAYASDNQTDGIISAEEYSADVDLNQDNGDFRELRNLIEQYILQNQISNLRLCFFSQ